MRNRSAKAVVAVGLLLTTVGVLQSPAQAAGGTIKVPELVVTGIGEDIDFNAAPDPYSAWKRQLIIAGGEDGPNGPCDHGAQPNDGVIGLDDGCFTVQISPSPGQIDIVGSNGFAGPGGSEFLQDPPTNGNLNIFGTRAEVNAALAALRWIAPDGYESSDNDPGSLTIFATDGAEDPIAFQNEDGDPFLDGSNNPVSPMVIEIRAENDPDVGPDLSLDVVTQPFPVAASTTPSTVDDEVVLSNFDGNGTDEFQDDEVFEDPDLDDDEADDFALFVVWLDPDDPADANFSLASFASPDCIYDSLDQFFAQTPGQPCTVIEEPYAVNFEASMFTGFIPTGLSFGTDIVNERAVVFLARYSSDENPENLHNSTAEDILTRIEFYPPQVDCDCTLSVLVHDLGNNGVPLPNLGAPPQEKGFLYPDLLGLDFETIDFKVRDADNDPPAVTATTPGPTPVDELATVPAAFTVTDSDAECDLTITSISAVGGTLGGAPANGTTGSPDALTAALAGMTFTGAEFTNHPGLGSVTVNVNDNGCGAAPDDQDEETGSDTATFQVGEDGTPDNDPDTDTNDPPVLTAPASIDVGEGVAFDLVDATIGVTDPDAGTDQLTMTITPTGGTTNADGPTTGTLTTLNATLDALTFTAAQDPDFADETLTPGISITVNDNGHNPDSGNPVDEGTDAATIDVNVDDDELPPDPVVNDPPTIVGPLSDTATEGIAKALADFTVADPDLADGDGLLDLTIGVTSGPGSTNSTGGTGITLAAAETILDGLTYTAPQDVDTADTSAIITITVNDRGNSGTGGAKQVSHAVSIAVDDDDDDPAPAVNDPPVISGPPTLAAVEGVLIDVGDFDVTDVDVGAGLVDLTIAVPAGEGTLSSTGANDISLAIAIATLDALTFTPAEDDADFADEIDVPIDITVNDNGNTGTGGALEDTHQVLIGVDDDDIDPGPNAAPTIDAPTGLSVETGQQLAFTGANAITIDDADAGVGDLLLQLDVIGTGGDVTAAAVPDSTGTLTELQQLLDGLVFTAGSPGPASITLTLDDQGNSGTGGAQTATATIDITITAAQDPGTTTTTTSTTLPGADGGGVGGSTTSTTAGPLVGAGGASRGTTLPRTGSDLLLLAGIGLVLFGAGSLLTERRRRHAWGR